MYAQKKRRPKQDFQPPSRSNDETSAGRASAFPNSSRVGADTSPDPSLAEKMQSRIGARFPGVDLLSRGSGRPLELPDELRENLESHFGASLENVRFRESSDADAIGAKAYARGDEIHFAPGQFRPDTEQGRKMIGHEVSHIRRQASGDMGGGVLLDDSQERQADVDGEAIAYGDAAPRQSASLSPMPTASFAAAPAQGWELKEHDILTKLARQKAAAYARQRASDRDLTELPAADRKAYKDMTAQREFDDPKAQKSLAYGAKFNDVGHHSLPGFLLNYKDHKSAFVNQSHHGDMQFLHSMDTSGGDTVENMARARRYARFASDVYQNKNTDENGVSVQNQNMLDYVLNDKGETDAEDSEVGRANGEGQPTRFQEMMLSTMLSAGKMKEINKRLDSEIAPDGKSKEQWRMELIKEAATSGQTAIQEAREKYRRKSGFKKWRAGSEQEYIRKKAAKAGLSKYAAGSVGDFFTGGDEDLDAGMVALGSASHMIEDSYAGSHASRGENLYLGDEGRKETALSETGEKITEKSTDVITSGDYNQQAATPFIGRHTHGDKFREDQGEHENEIVNNTRGGALARDAAAQFMIMNAREKYGGAGGANDFLKGILKTDLKAASLPGGPTRTGSAYAKKVGGANDVENEAAKQFRASTNARTYNVHADASTRAHEYEEQMSQLETLRASTNPETRAHYQQQSNEMFAQMNSMIAQLEKAQGKGGLDPENAAALQALKAQRKKLAKQLSVYEPN